MLWIQRVDHQINVGCSRPKRGGVGKCFNDVAATDRYPTENVLTKDLLVDVPTIMPRSCVFVN